MSKPTSSGFIPLSEPLISGQEWAYIKDCLDTGWVSSVGAYVDRFESMVAGYVGASNAVAAVNGTSALHVSLVAIGVRPGDEVIVPSITFIAPVNAVRYCFAEPVFIDCDPDTLCMDVSRVEEFLSERCETRGDGHAYNKRTGRRVSAAIPVHIFGHPVDMDPLMDICGKYKIDVIEDATESLGSEYKGKKTGSLGRAGCFSFNGNKIITTGGGGMITTSDAGLAKKLKHLTTQAKIEGIEYDHDEIGYNYRLPNLLAAMGTAQMERIEEIVNIKRDNAALYDELFKGINGLKMLGEREWAKSNCWFYTLKVEPGTKDGLLAHLIENKIQARPLWKPIHTLRMYNMCERIGGGNAEYSYDTCMNIPCSAGISRAEIERVAQCIKGYIFKSKIVK